jgi:hypothetical protein
LWFYDSVTWNDVVSVRNEDTVITSYGYPWFFYQFPEFFPNIAIAYGISAPNVILLTPGAVTLLTNNLMLRESFVFGQRVCGGFVASARIDTLQRHFSAATEMTRSYRTLSQLFCIC